MVTFSEKHPSTTRSKRDNYNKATDLSKLHFSELKSKCQSCSSYLMKGCHNHNRNRYSCCCYCRCSYSYELLLLLVVVVDNSKRYYESDLTFTSITTTTMETDDSYNKNIIMNQSSESAITSNKKGPTLLGTTTTSTVDAFGINSRIYLVNESVCVLATRGINHHYCDPDISDSVNYMTGNPVISSNLQPIESSPASVSGIQITPANCRSTISRSSANNCSSSIPIRYLWLLEMCIILMLSVCLVQAGFWTFYFPNFLKVSGYKELTDMIESVEKQINSTMDAHADALYFWRQLKNTEAQFMVNDNNDNNDDDDDNYYPEESVCEEIFPLFRDKAIKYVDIDYKYFIRPLILYREHLLTKRDIWFPDGPKSDSILPRQYEQDLYKKDLELKIESFDELTNDPELREMREEMIIIWRNVKRNLDSSLLCLYLRYSYRHMATDINQFALDMNLQSLHQAMSMLESAYKRISIYKDQDRAAIEKIDENIERQQNLVMID